MDWLSYVSQINWLAVLPAFAATMAIGFVWYMPAVLAAALLAVLMTAILPVGGQRP